MRFVGYALIIGAMKSGTSSLYRMLAQHPEIVVGRKKELNYFRKAEVPDVRRYEANFPLLDKSRHAYALDSSPNYTKAGKWPNIAERIARFPGTKRLIYLLRDPIERIESHIAHNIQRGRWTREGRWNMDHLLDISRYARQLVEYEKAGLLKDLVLLDFEELRADPLAFVDKVQDILDIAKVEPASVLKWNQRTVEGRFLRPDQIEELREALKDDVGTLIGRYGFEPAKAWGIA